jgi:mycofactocin system glycosyltransferase
MENFFFALTSNTCLEKNSDGYLLISRAPLKIMRLNQSLFHLLEHLHKGGNISEFTNQSPGMKEGQLLRELLLLTAKGYLRLEKVALPQDYPKVSVILPVRDQPVYVSECLQSLMQLNYPHDRLEVLVVDDGSRNSLAEITSTFKVNLIRLEESQGAAVCRNIGAESASGDILAFLDADCIADRDWLREITPFFQAEGVGAVGGFVAGYYQKRLLDRYEEVASPLNMGQRLIFEVDAKSTFYVPTCNLLVKSQVFRDISGFKPGMTLGEDVDFCWRMRSLGYNLLYVPMGRVAHKHRNHLPKMLKRRSEYGTSEAGLYRIHRDKKKRLPVSIPALLSLIALLLAIFLQNPYLISFILLFGGLDLYQKHRILKHFKVSLPCIKLFYSALRSYFSFGYFALFHLVRYYLILMLALGFLAYPVWFFCGAALLLTSGVDYRVKKPKLNYPSFLFFYTLEHLAYQTGVFWGCLRLRYFRSYLPVLSRL